MTLEGDSGADAPHSDDRSTLFQSAGSQPKGTPDASPPELSESDLRLPGRRQGKVRDLYDLPPDRVGPRRLMVASDRVSVFDVVLATPIPGKGQLLCEIAAFWLRWIESRGLARTHLLSTDVDDVPASAFAGRTTRDDLRGRSMIVRAARVIPIEFVARGYLEGSGWKEYQERGTACGIPLPSGLRRCDQLPEPIFTPATKAPMGQHDENIPFDRACEIVGGELMEALRDATLSIYREASAYALDRGIIIADTKFEFGYEVGDQVGNELGAEPDAAGASRVLLIDEALTPDSSRFWPADDYEPGRAQRSFDKQYVRDFLQSAYDRGEWDKRPPGPALPPEIVGRTLDKYREARDRLTT